MRITDQVIEEVDEQMTITSQRQPEIRPTAQSLFEATAAPSAPVDVPAYRPAANDYTRTQSFVANDHRHHHPFTFPTTSDDYQISSSAPVTGSSSHQVVTPTGDIYDICIEDFDETRPNSQSSIINVPPTPPTASGKYNFEKTN